MLKKAVHLFYVVLFFSLTGCATQTNVPLSPTFWGNTHQKIIVANYKPSPPALYKQGGQGLLDIAISDAVMNQFDSNLKNTDLSSYNNLKNQFSDKLKDKDFQAIPYANDIAKDDDPKTNTTFAAQTDADVILTFELVGAGASRPYYGFIPLGSPQAFCTLKGEMVDARTHQILWRDFSTVIQPIPGEWDQPPHYPNFNKALLSVIKYSADNLSNDFFQGSPCNQEN